MMKKATQLFLGSVLLAAFLFASGCSTFRGFGKDLENLGESIQETGEK